MRKSMNKPVITRCYGEEKYWNTRKEAIDHFLMGMLCCEGAEQDRYSKIYCELECGMNVCTDEY